MRSDASTASSLDGYRDILEIRGRVAEMTEKGADAHIDALAKKYIGQDRYPCRHPGRSGSW